MDRIIYVKDVMQQLNVKTGYLYKLIKNGELKSFKMGKKRAFMQSQIDAYVFEQSGMEELKVVLLSPQVAMSKGLTDFEWNRFTYEQLCCVWSLIGKLEGNHEQ